MMLDDVIYLTPAEDAVPRDFSIVNTKVPATDPPIMIPGIAEDGSLYAIEKIQAHVEGRLHLALSVFIFDGDKLLIQQRAHDKYHCGGMWANTCCTHPHMGEDIEIAAIRRLQEELGFWVPVHEKRIVEYSADVGNGLWERERVHMFRADVRKDDLVIAPNPDEVCDTRWIGADELKQDIEENPENYTPWFKIYVKRFPELDF